jgi:hypothetical protein
MQVKQTQALTAFKVLRAETVQAQQTAVAAAVQHLLAETHHLRQLVEQVETVTTLQHLLAEAR